MNVKSNENENSNGYTKENRGFLLEDGFSSSDSDTNSELDLRLARDNVVRIKDKIHKKNVGQDEEEKIPFVAHKVSRTPSVEKISNRIDILLNINSISEDNHSQNGDGHDEVNIKRQGSELDTDEEILKEGKIELQKKVKL